jgi:cobalt-precorrin 5A hydrolase
MVRDDQRLAVVALTRGGIEIADRIRRARPHAELFCPEPIAPDNRDVHRFAGRLHDLIPHLLAHYDGLICVMALGIVVRLIAPLARGKIGDPAVVVVDETGRFAISVLSGHSGGANQLARGVAEILGAIPVITTASDARGLPAVDLIGREFGWVIEQAECLAEVASAVVNGHAVAVYQDAGEPDWWQLFGAWPEHFHRVDGWPGDAARFAAALVISDRLHEGPAQAWAGRLVIYRPRTLHVGIGCRRGTSLEEIEEVFQSTFRQHRLAPASVASVATAWLKRDEPAVIEFARRLAVPLQVFTADELQAVGTPPNPSARVRSKIGLVGVAEPAAMLAARTCQLTVPKQTGRSVTLAVARIQDSLSEPLLTRATVDPYATGSASAGSP